jgi:hypothetical protein
MVDVGIRSDSNSQFDQDKLAHLLRFYKIDMKSFSGVTAKCESVQSSLDQLLTCLFPPGTPIKMGLSGSQNGGIQVEISSDALGVDIKFWVLNVEIY